MDRRDEEVRPLNQNNGPQPLKENDISERVILTVFSIIMNTIFGWIFYIYSTDDSKNGGNECRMLRPLGFYFACYCFLSLSITIIVNPFALWTQNSTMLKIFDITYVVEGSVRLMFFLLFLLGFVLGASCGALRWITAGYLVLNFTVFALSCCLEQIEKIKYS